jgi:hypothetical protein
MRPAALDGVVPIHEKENGPVPDWPKQPIPFDP